GAGRVGGDPEGAVWRRDQPTRRKSSCRQDDQGDLPDRAARADAPNLVAAILDKPDGVVWSLGEARRRAADRRRVKDRPDAAGRQSADVQCTGGWRSRVGAREGEPERAVLRRQDETRPCLTV